MRVVLLAESHVFTGAADLERCIVRLPGAPAGIPTGFVRLVYCLGYGENDILDRRISEPPNTGTPQFWRIFASCVGGPPRSADFRATLGSTSPQPCPSREQARPASAAPRCRRVAARRLAGGVVRPGSGEADVADHRTGDRPRLRAARPLRRRGSGAVRDRVRRQGCRRRARHTPAPRWRLNHGRTAAERAVDHGRARRRLGRVFGGRPARTVSAAGASKRPHRWD